ncbi:MAG: nucleotide exchange factor GrpE [Acidobacteria bacterium]|nr:nucleotide exchange factor GrpE [Acidobacteriota bacterium]
MNIYPSNPEEAAEAAATNENSFDDVLRQLRMRRFQNENASWLTPTETLSEAVEDEDDLELEVEEDDNDLELATQDEDEDYDQEESETARFDFDAAFELLGEEIKRVGRESFKTNRTTERSQELFTEALNEIRQLSAAVALIPAQNEEKLQDARFEAKATMSRELVRMFDTLESSVAAVDELLAQLQSKHVEPRGFAFQFAATRELQSSLGTAVNALTQWRDGQKLLTERLRAILQSAGVRAIEAVGRAFDPAWHRAVSVAQRYDVAPNQIVGEELKGYTLDGRMLRYAEVIVSKHE